MKIKKILAALSAAAMIVSVSAVNVSANLPNTPSADNSCYLEFEMTSDGAIVAGAINDEGEPADVEEIDIPEKTDAGIPIVGIRGFAFAKCDNLKKVTVPDTITFIDDAAFLKTEDIDTFLEANGLSLTEFSDKEYAYAANMTSFMGKDDWKGDEEELENAKTVFNNVQNTLLNSEVTPSSGEFACILYNHSDLSDIVRTGEEDTLEKMSMKTYESFLAWIATIPYVDFTVKANDESYAHAYANGKAILGIKYEPNETHIIGDANGDGEVNVRDCAKIANALAFKTVDKLPCLICADYNQDGEVTVRDAAQLANFLAKKK